MPIPSARTIAQRLGVPMETGRAVRMAMETHERLRIPFATDTIETIGAILDDAGVMSFGAEWIPPGRGRRSPSIDYANRGDTYAPTILYLDGVTESGRPTGRGRWSVGAWGDIVERGNYQYPPD